MTTTGFTPSEPIEEISLSQLLGEAIGAASTSWANVEENPLFVDGTVFDEAYASTIVDTIKSYIESNYVLNKTEEPDPDKGERDSVTLTSDITNTLTGEFEASVIVTFDYPKGRGLLALETLTSIPEELDQWGVEATMQMIQAGDAEIMARFNEYVEEEFGN